MLAELDVVIASVHSATSQSREEMTERLHSCLRESVRDDHRPSDRRAVLRRVSAQGYEFDYDAVFAAAARTGTALEIDGQAARLDLPAPLARMAKSYGVTFALDSDAHRTGDLAAIEFAVGQARRAGLGEADVLNARPLEEVRAFVARKRERGMIAGARLAGPSGRATPRGRALRLRARRRFDRGDLGRAARSVW